MARKSEPNPTAAVAADDPAIDVRRLAHRHLLIGWASVFVFVSLGLALEALHGLKVEWYLNVSHSTRRLMLTLAHAHGTLLGVLEIAFGVTVLHLTSWRGSSRDIAARSLMAASLLVPLGFLLGGVILHGDDPGLGVLLVPPGALLLMLAAALTLRALWRDRG